MNKISKISFYLFFAIVAYFFNINTIEAQATSVSQGGIVKLTLLPHHEDSAIQVQVDFLNYSPANYASIGIMCTKENGLKPPVITPTCGNFIKTTGRGNDAQIIPKIYTTTISNLKPDSTYEICLTGIRKVTFTSTGYIECTTIKTQPLKNPEVLIYINYDVSSRSRDFIRRYENSVKWVNPTFKINEYAPSQKISSSDLISYLKKSYASTNLKYLVLIGFDLPIPTIDPLHTSYFSDDLRHLSIDKTVMETDFGYTLNDEISIAAIRPDNEQDMINYFNRLYDFYRGAIKFDKKILFADAMIPSEAAFGLNDIPVRYSLASTDYVTGVTNYFDPNIENTKKWQSSFSNFLSTSHEITVINAHGATKFHYPCQYNTDQTIGCISSYFIKQAQPNSELFLAISCNIGNFMTPGSPLVAYVFSGKSLAGLGSEVLFWDNNSMAAKSSLKQMAEGKMIGDISPQFGFVVVGDPFLRIGMPQTYISSTNSPTPTPTPTITGTPLTSALDNSHSFIASVFYAIGDFLDGLY